MKLAPLAIVAALLIATGPSFADEVEAEAVIVHKGKIPISMDAAKDFEIVGGNEEVTGDPESGKKAGYASWKTACAEWKKEFKENNKANQIITINCNSPTFTQDSGNYTYTSQASYKMKVRVRGGAAAPKE